MSQLVLHADTIIIRLAIRHCLGKVPQGARLHCAVLHQAPPRGLGLLWGRLLTLLENLLQVPVPRALCMCQDDAVVGTPFYVMSFVGGRVFDDLSLPELAPPERTQVQARTYARHN